MKTFTGIKRNLYHQHEIVLFSQIGYKYISYKQTRFKGFEVGQKGATNIDKWVNQLQKIISETLADNSIVMRKLLP